MHDFFYSYPCNINVQYKLKHIFKHLDCLYQIHISFTYTCFIQSRHIQLQANCGAFAVKASAITNSILEVYHTLSFKKK